MKLLGFLLKLEDRELREEKRKLSLLLKKLQELEERYPGLHISLQGEKKNMRESFGSLKVTFPLAVVGIFVIIATIFRSYIQPMVILVTVPCCGGGYFLPENKNK
jgi:multidrug efflux pump subunit AcrB